MGNNKKSIQFFLYALFYVSRVTNLTTPRSAPECTHDNEMVMIDHG